MARYTGPKHRIARRLGVNVLEKTTGTLQRKLNIPPGLHGTKRRRKLSEFGIQLKEKQKAKAVYGLLEKQFKNLVKKAQEKKGDTGEMLISMLETRLDNLVYRLGFANTRFMARQLVGHGHINVDGKKVSIPSYQVKEGQVIALSSKMIKNPQIAKLLEEEIVVVPFIDKKAHAGKLLRMPNRSDVEVLFDTQLIVEYYSR